MSRCLNGDTRSRRHHTLVDASHLRSTRRVQGQKHYQLANKLLFEHRDMEWMQLLECHRGDLLAGLPWDGQARRLRIELMTQVTTENDQLVLSQT